MKVRPYFAWYDLWFGAYWDRRKRHLYIGVPFLGLRVEFAAQQQKGEMT